MLRKKRKAAGGLRKDHTLEREKETRQGKWLEEGEKKKKTVREGEKQYLEKNC